jgi:hypothetical protein
LEEYKEFCEAIGDQVEDWKKVVLDWETGTSTRNPYAVVDTGKYMSWKIWIGLTLRKE